MNKSTLDPQQWDTDATIYYTKLDGIDWRAPSDGSADRPVAPKVETPLGELIVRYVVSYLFKGVPLDENEDDDHKSDEANENEKPCDYCLSSTLQSLGIESPSITPRSPAQLAASGFENFPYRILEKTVLLSPDCLPTPKALPAYVEALNESSELNVVWSKDNTRTLFVDTPAESHMASWSYQWRLTPRYCMGMKCGVQDLSTAYSDNTPESLASHVVSCMEQFFFSARENLPLCNPFKEDTTDLMTAGPFFVNRNTYLVESAIPGQHLEDTAMLLGMINTMAGSHLGTSNSPLPVIVGQFNTNESSEQCAECTLIEQMASIREMMELVWVNPPEFNFGFLIDNEQWRIYAMKRDASNTPNVELVFAHPSTTFPDRAYIITVLHRLAVYVHWQLTGVTIIPMEERYELLKQLTGRKRLNHAQPLDEQV